MSIPRKGSRKITVDGRQYTWIATGNDDVIDLVVCDNDSNGQKLQAQFKYQIDYTSRPAVYNFVITPAIVRQVILYGLAQGWTPTQRNPHLQLGFLDDKIAASAGVGQQRG